MRCDLHIHSIYSDGSFSPKEIVSEAKRLGLTVALTDHNTVSGLPEFLEEAERQGVTAIPGIEISTDYRGKELHLLGLFLETQHYSRMEQVMKKYHALKEDSNRELVERLRDAKYLIDYETIKKTVPEGNVNRAHIGAALMEKGYVESIREAFRTVLKEGAGFYVPPARLGLLDGISLLREMNAITVLAHPLQELSGQELRQMLPEAIGAGLIGIETQHSSYHDEEFELAAQIAGEFNLLASGGSDFHGRSKPDVFLGMGKGNLSIPARVYEDLLDKKRSL